MLPFVEQLLSDNPDIELLSPSLEDLGKDEKGTFLWLGTCGGPFKCLPDGRVISIAAPRAKD
jgi:hypothetical protein